MDARKKGEMRLPETLILAHFSQWQRKLGLNCYQQSFPQFGRITAGARCARLHLPPDSEAFSTPGANQFTGSALHHKSGLFLKWRFPSEAGNDVSEGGRALNYWVRFKKAPKKAKKTMNWGGGGGGGVHNCSQRSPHALPCFCMLSSAAAQWGEGESSSRMQSPAAYTLPVKPLTSTNDFLMIGPTIPRSCLLAKQSH